MQLINGNSVRHLKPDKMLRKILATAIDMSLVGTDINKLIDGIYLTNASEEYIVNVTLAMREHLKDKPLILN